MIMNKQKLARNLMVLFSISAVVALFFVDPIKQDLSYHNFIDNNSKLNIANFWNVASNVPFLIVGLMGLLQFKRLKIITEMGVAYWIMFFGLILVAFGSGYYHLAPSNHTLVWDRLPMTIAFMSLFAIVISEFINERVGALLLIPLLVIGAASVFYWQWTESNGVGDLRFYALVQFLPIILIPIILLLYPSKFVNITAYWWLLLAYVAAKILEYYDAEIFELLRHTISGHSIKHVAAALGMLFLLNGYKNRIRIHEF
jgi:hypothetical protein